MISLAHGLVNLMETPKAFFPSSMGKFGVFVEGLSPVLGPQARKNNTSRVDIAN